MVENYSLEEPIGEGSYGKVYKAINIKTNKLVAIKVVKIQKFKENPKLEECTVNEIKILSQVNDDKHVVQFIELLRSSNNYYFVYEYCNGGTLEDQLKKKKIFQEKEALQILKQLLESFKTLRKLNIMHRDLKPTNILLHDGIIKLADFGFCKSLSKPDQMAQTMLGSPLYMAPEILRGQDYCVKADIWSLGVVFYELLFGFCPFEEKSIAKLINLLNDGKINIRKDIQKISMQTEVLLYAMLVKDPENRISWDQLFQIQISDEGEYIMPKSNNSNTTNTNNSNLSSNNNNILTNNNSNNSNNNNNTSNHSDIDIIRVKTNEQQFSDQNFNQNQDQFCEQMDVVQSYKSENEISLKQNKKQPSENTKNKYELQKEYLYNNNKIISDFNQLKIKTQSSSPPPQLQQNVFKQQTQPSPKIVIKQNYSYQELNTALLQQDNQNEKTQSIKLNSQEVQLQIQQVNKNTYQTQEKAKNIQQESIQQDHKISLNVKQQQSYQTQLSTQKYNEQYKQTSNNIQQKDVQNIIVSQQNIDTQANSQKYQRNNHKRTLSSIGTSNNYQKPLGINNNIVNIQNINIKSSLLNQKQSTQEDIPLNVDDVCLNNLDLKKQDSIQINLKLNLNPNFEFETIDKFLDFINRERNKLQYCTLLLYEIINVSDSPTYNLILPQISYQYYQQILNSKCEFIKMNLQNYNQECIQSEKYIILKGILEQEVYLIEYNFQAVKNEYFEFEQYYSQQNTKEQVQLIKQQQLNQIIKNFIKQVIANNESDFGGEVEYLNRLKICAKLVDVFDLDDIIFTDCENQQYYQYLKEINSANKQKILSKIFNHSSLSPIN